MTMRSESFAAFILSNRRPDRVFTYTALKKHGYTGRIFIVIDDADPTLEEYRRRYGEQVVVFNKAEVARSFDLADNFYEKTNVVVFARNAVMAIAERLNVATFIQLDDDYLDFWYKFDREGQYKHTRIKSLDRVFSAIVTFQAKTPAVTVCMAQMGDFLGGANSSYGSTIGLRRKAMNTFMCALDRPLRFVGRINEDVNTYVTDGQRGVLFLTINTVAVNQKKTQSNKGGLTEFYLDVGTYVKSFYTVMMAPSCVRISTMGKTDRRVHHKVLWRYAVPKIVDEGHRKPDKTAEEQP